MSARDPGSPLGVPAEPSDGDAAPGHADSPSNRGFWIVAGAMALTAVVLVVAIVANRGLRDAVGHAQASLRRAQEAAEAIRARDGALAAADGRAIASAAPDLVVLAPDEPSVDPGQVSVYVGPRGWAAAAAARPQACFWLRITPSGTVRYGAGEGCTGLDASSADDARW
ncbi:MAG: hypothetical protein KatS3mg013_1856 [Actinomycetota bacterium]|nr:MAG: hypothetical protein KatS3mg013_1856 [Actinomycetota bacterium]